MTNFARRKWLKHSSLAALGLGFSLRSIAGEDYMPYNFEPQTGLVILGANENPYGISEKAKEAIKEIMPYANRYSGNVPLIQTFKKELADFYHVTPEQTIIMPGSGEGLRLLARQYSNGNLVTATPTFGILPTTARKLGMEVIEVPLTAGKVHDLEAMQKAVTAKTSLVYICNPANPTATVLKPDALKNFCIEASGKAMVLIDEAYIDFPDAPYNESMLGLIEDHPNIIVMGTFSKIHGMAGLRIGYVFAHADTIKKLQAGYFDNPQYSVSNLAQYAAMASLKDAAHRTMTREKNAAARQYTYDALVQMKFHCIPSYTNFMFFNLGNYKGDFAADMLQRNILVRSNDYPDGKWARVSFGNMDDMKQFIAVMKTMFPA
ncbi:histidinol-phosphate aminotransferase family protein [Panacibacter sp. DH6]|uniref:Histidinol-phosphate aminotransferase family protein n=1 Tax=Panacibacter microcysteis TaxID=2793269 RepID=A0A931GXT6_9BACT|nr:histidinol-phosphate transaminase [Panacibacter microcysteis]MBG9376559.1 histidinol-phosphate aminotransferase family protein [Panacibacter microcysteis]